jgi:hypothetical protein
MVAVRFGGTLGVEWDSEEMVARGYRIGEDVEFGTDLIG